MFFFDLRGPRWTPYPCGHGHCELYDFISSFSCMHMYLLNDSSLTVRESPLNASIEIALNWRNEGIDNKRGYVWESRHFSLDFESCHCRNDGVCVLLPRAGQRSGRVPYMTNMSSKQSSHGVSKKGRSKLSFIWFLSRRHVQLMPVQKALDFMTMQMVKLDMNQHARFRILSITTTDIDENESNFTTQDRSIVSQTSLQRPVATSYRVTAPDGLSVCMYICICRAHRITETQDIKAPSATTQRTTNAGTVSTSRKRTF